MTTADKLAEALRDLVELYDSDEGCRSLPQYRSAQAALAEYKREKAGQAEYICRKCGLRQSQNLPPPEF